jgi:16S rRNA (uracil1498-N3)-methyltransferase
VPWADHVDESVELPKEEGQHVTRVLRLKPGAAVRVFNGRGAEFEALVETVTKGRVSVRTQTRREPAAEPRVAVTLAQAVLKGDGMDDVVRDAVMMGVAVIQPMVTTRTEVTVAALERGRRCERWQRVAIASAKQCGRATVPKVLDPRGFADITVALSHLTLPSPALMLVEPSVQAGTRVETHALSDLPPPARETTLLVGPEGGWTQAEVDQGAAASRLVTLGGRTLRADAMAIVALAALFAIWREY